MPPGGALVMYTDGVIETRSTSRAFFGEERLADLVLRARDWPAQTMCDSVMAAVATHGDGLPQQDDITVLCTRRLPESDPACGKDQAGDRDERACGGLSQGACGAREPARVIRRFVDEQARPAGFLGSAA